MPDTVPTTAIRVERHDTVVIGAGQAGLAAGYHLRQRGAEFVILEAAERLGSAWRKRWDSLHVFTSAAFTGLPGLPFPTAQSHLPRKDELADYLEGYAAHFALPVRLNTKVESLRRECGRFLIDAGEVTYIARHVVVATGPFQTPRSPKFARELNADIHQLHSSAYRNPSELPPGNVLVVGMGNAGVRIALEVSEHRPVTLAGPRTHHVWRTLFGRDIHWWLWPVVRRLTTETRLGRLLRRRLVHDPLVGVSEADLAAAHVERRGRVSGVRSGRPVADGESLDVRTIIWCTGFAPDFSWIRIPLAMEGGAPVTHRGVVTEVPGLYFVGLPFQHTLASALIAGVGEDAGFVVGKMGEEKGAGGVRDEACARVARDSSSVSVQSQFRSNGSLRLSSGR